MARFAGGPAACRIARIASFRPNTNSRVHVMELPQAGRWRCGTMPARGKVARGIMQGPMRVVLPLMGVVALLSVLLPDTAAAPKVRVASAAKNQVQGIIGGGTRALSAGSEIFSNEIVRTGEESLAQLLFLDETSLSVGARSEVKLDRFVYNPDRKTGNVVLEASRGAFRF